MSSLESGAKFLNSYDQNVIYNNFCDLILNRIKTIPIMLQYHSDVNLTERKLKQNSDLRLTIVIVTT